MDLAGAKKLEAEGNGSQDEEDQSGGAERTDRILAARPEGVAIERRQPHDRCEGHQRFRGQQLLPEQQLDRSQDAEPGSNQQRTATLADQDMVQGKEHEGWSEQQDQGRMSQRVRHHVGRESVEKSAEAGGDPALDEVAKDEVRGPGREPERKRLGRVVGQHRGGLRDRPEQQAQQGSRRVPHQIDARRIVEVVGEERAEVMG